MSLIWWSNEAVIGQSFWVRLECEAVLGGLWVLMLQAVTSPGKIVSALSLLLDIYQS